MGRVSAGALATGLVFAPACSDEQVADSSGEQAPGDSADGDAPINLGTTTLTDRSANCADYANTYSSTATDVGRGQQYEGSVEVTTQGDKCLFAVNSIPNHDFNDGDATFMTPVTEMQATYELPANPAMAAAPTELSLQYDNAIFLNGVKLDLLAAACYGVGNEPLGQEKIGCFEEGTPWRYDPMFPGNEFGTDSHNAHTQPDGTYHYHGNPHALFPQMDPASESPVIGFAADGFPIYGSFIDEGGTIREVVSGYTLRSGERASLAGEGAFPGGSPDGTYRDDYEFTGAGDLDECNGMLRDGSYGYYVTNSYPWVLGCYRGTPDASFRKGMP